MAQILTFYDDKHEYELNGEIIPCVSEISRFASREIYSNIEQFRLDNAAERGRKVHKSTEILDKYNEVECDIDIEPYIRAYINFRKEYKVDKFKAIEQAIAEETMMFAGTIDRVVEITPEFAETFKQQTKVDVSDKIGKLAIIDIKSSSTMQNVLANIQLNAYKKLVEYKYKQNVGLLIIVHLKKEQKYKVHNVELDDTLFMSCYNLSKAFEKKKKVNKEKNNGKD